ncbi:MAG: hypothetical protein ACLUIF_04285 [Roseburia sp.]
MKIFCDTGLMEQSAHFGWQNKDSALYGLREGYKNSADDLVNIAISNGADIKTLDTYIFPILFSYRHALELSLKHIYLRTRGVMPKGGHDLLVLWGIVKKEIIDDMINSNEFVEQVKNYKENFIKYSLDGISLDKVRLLLKELQEANQKTLEIDTSKKQIDQNAEVWRYLISTDDELFFCSSHSVDYLVLQDSFNYLYETFDYIYHIVDEYLSS